MSPSAAYWQAGKDRIAQLLSSKHSVLPLVSVIVWGSKAASATTVTSVALSGGAPHSHETSSP